LMKVFSFILKK